MNTKDFTQQVKKAVRGIPEGQVLTYGQVSEHAGFPGAARAVGTFLAKNTDTDIPCHRVVQSSGTIGQYNGLQGDKEQLLRQEGVSFTRLGVVDIKRYE
jgi:O-6-methylguanine DNA methyltransferase